MAETTFIHRMANRIASDHIIKTMHAPKVLDRVMASAREASAVSVLRPLVTAVIDGQERELRLPALQFPGHKFRHEMVLRAVSQTLSLLAQRAPGIRIVKFTLTDGEANHVYATYQGAP